MIADLLKRAGLGLGGMVLVLAWWSIRGGGDSGPAPTTLKALPERVWESGPKKLEVDYEVTGPGPARLIAHFYDHDGGETKRRVDVDEEIKPGRRKVAVNMPAKTDVYLELNTATVGTKLSWAVSVGGEVQQQDEISLDAPLKPGYACFLQYEE